MALLTLLDIAQAAAAELGLPYPANMVSSTRSQDRQMLALFNAGGRALARSHDWKVLNTLATITTVVDQEDYALATDYDRMVDETHWDLSNNLRLAGPDIPQWDRARRGSGIANGGIRRTYRLVDSATIRIYPAPTTADETLVYEYISKNWVLSSGASAQALFLADTDTPRLDPDLLVKYVKWRFLRAKGMNSDIEFAELGDLKDKLVAADLGGGTLNMEGVRAELEGEVFAGAEPNFIVIEGGDFLEWE